MLIPSSARSNLHGPAFLRGGDLQSFTLQGLRGNAAVEGLQKALVNLAQATQRPAINPGPVDGIVGSQTMAAVSAALGLLSEELPNWLYLALQTAMIAGANTSQAKQFVTSYAPQLTIAANTAAVKFKTAAPVVQPAATPANTGFLSTIFPPGWYKRPSLGWVIVGIGAFAGYKLILAPSKK